MNLLLVYATHFEANRLLQKLNIESNKDRRLCSFNIEGINIDLLVTGIGMVNTAFFLGKQFESNSYDVALNVGLAGSFDHSMHLGDVVNITTECISELGAEDGDNFLPIDQMNPGMTDELDSPYELLNNSEVENEAIAKLSSVKGISVNTVHGEINSIEKVKTLFSPSVESMEGAAFFIACKDVGIRFAEIRAISNYVEERDTSKWEIDKALDSLSTSIEEILKAF
jgi:futalosine hydrolase